MGYLNSQFIMFLSLQNNEKQVKDIEQLKEQYVIKFQEISNNIGMTARYLEF